MTTCKQYIYEKESRRLPSPGADPAFFLGGGALLSCSTLTPINHKTAGHLGGGGIAHPLHPPPRSAPALLTGQEGQLIDQHRTVRILPDAFKKKTKIHLIFLKLSFLSFLSQRSRVRIPYKPEFFSGFLFSTAKVAYIL